MVFLGMYTPFFYVPRYATETSIMLSDVAFYTVTAMNLASIPGRIVPGFLAQQLRPMNMIVGTSVALAACGVGLLGGAHPGDCVCYVGSLRIFYRVVLRSTADSLC
jgi:hypothetical protein